MIQTQYKCDTNTIQTRYECDKNKYSWMQYERQKNVIRTLYEGDTNAIQTRCERDINTIQMWYKHDMNAIRTNTCERLLKGSWKACEGLVRGQWEWFTSSPIAKYQRKHSGQIVVCQNNVFHQTCPNSQFCLQKLHSNRLDCPWRVPTVQCQAMVGFHFSWSVICI